MTTFNVPDGRESALVGAGVRTTGVAAHDTYSAGQFKDDQVQGHFHAVSNGLVYGNYTPVDLYLTSSGTTFNVQKRTVTIGPPTNDGTNGAPRTGPTSHGKRLGVNYFIRY